MIRWDMKIRKYQSLMKIENTLIIVYRKTKSFSNTMTDLGYPVYSLKFENGIRVLLKSSCSCYKHAKNKTTY